MWTLPSGHRRLAWTPKKTWPGFGHCLKREGAMSDAASEKVSVLFVCLGNICRSPSAEGVFRQLAAEQGLLESLHIDSCGTVTGTSARPRTPAPPPQRSVAASILRSF